MQVQRLLDEVGVVDDCAFRGKHERTKGVSFRRILPPLIARLKRREPPHDSPCLPDLTPLPTHILVFNHAYLSFLESVSISTHKRNLYSSGPGTSPSYPSRAAEESA